MISRPMLAATAKTPQDIWFPCSATPKIDGIRALRIGGSLLTRSFKMVQNAHIQRLCQELPPGLDGELLVGDTFQSTTSGVMKRDGEPKFTYLVFDYVSGDLSEPYTSRIERLTNLSLPDFCSRVLPTHLYDMESLLAFESDCLQVGYEGIMTRSAVGPYKCGRSTLNEQLLIKLKRIEHSEAIVLNIVEGQTNLNPIVPNAFGYARRPGGKTLKVLRGTMGHLECRDIYSGVYLSIGSGFDDETRAEIWEDPSAFIGQIARYSYQSVGVKDKPRFPRFTGWRHPEDLDADIPAVS